MKRSIVGLVAALQVAMPIAAYAQNDSTSQIAISSVNALNDINYRANIANRAEQVNNELKLSYAESAAKAHQIAIDRQMLKVAETECDTTCQGPATRAALDALKVLGGTTAGLTAATYTYRRLAAKYAREGAVKSEMSLTFKAASASVFVLSSLTVGLAALREHYATLRDAVPLREIKSAEDQLATDQAAYEQLAKGQKALMEKSAALADAMISTKEDAAATAQVK